MPIDWNKPVMTRDGRKVRILCTDAKNMRSIVGIVSGPHVSWQTGRESHGEEPHSWHPDGSHTKKGGKERESPLDLINVPAEPVTMWTNVFKGSAGEYFTDSLYDSEADANAFRISDKPPHRLYVATTSITFRQE